MCEVNFVILDFQTWGEVRVAINYLNPNMRAIEAAPKLHILFECILTVPDIGIIRSLSNNKACTLTLESWRFSTKSFSPFLIHTANKVKHRA
jgi:hypothetical protein